jgi:hypothetical protein
VRNRWEVVNRHNRIHTSVRVTSSPGLVTTLLLSGPILQPHATAGLPQISNEVEFEDANLTIRDAGSAITRPTRTERPAMAARRVRRSS